MGSKGGGQDPVVGYLYSFGIVMGLCRGPIDEIVEIRVSDIATWETPIVDGTQIYINKPGLFGGTKQEGGIDGIFRLYKGAADQVIDSDVKGLIGGLVPDFRGVATAYFNGEICAMSPYPKAWKFRVRRTTSGWDNDTCWYPEKCQITLTGPSPGDHATSTIQAMNVVHVLYEALTNRAWGRGLPASMIDDTNWRAAADTTYTEGLGVCARWAQTDTIANFISAIVNLANCAINIDRHTGLFVIKLIRGDYDPLTIPLFTYGTGLVSITDNQIIGGPNVLNQIIATYHDPVLDVDAQIRVNNPASIQALGAVYSQTSDYSQIPTPDLCARLASRDLMAYTGINSYKIKLDRRGYNLQPGDPFAIEDPARDIAFDVLRVATIEDSTDGDGTIVVTCATDVYGLPFDVYFIPQSQTWSPPGGDPTHISSAFIDEASHRDIVVSVPSVQVDSLAPGTGIAVFGCARPAPAAIEYGVYTTTNGSAATHSISNWENWFVKKSKQSWCPSARLLNAVGPYDTVLELESFTDPYLIAQMNYNGSSYKSVRIGAGSTRTSGLDEICAIYNVNIDTGIMLAYRGCADTPPRGWPAGQLMFFVDDLLGFDPAEYMQGEIVYAALTSCTTTQEEPISSALSYSAAIQGRVSKPYLMANLYIQGNGMSVGAPALVGNTVGAGPITLEWTLATPISFTWSRRNRITQADVLFPYTYGDIAPEPDTTYTFMFQDFVAGDPPWTKTYTVDGSAVYWVYTHDMWVADGSKSEMALTIRVYRDGLPSYALYYMLLFITG